MTTVLLYHYTCAHHLQAIVDSEKLILTESNIDPIMEHAGPDVVWFTTDPDLRHGHGLDNNAPAMHLWNKKRIRITVEVPADDVVHWASWAVEQGIPAVWQKALAKAGGMDTWMVLLREVPISEWVEIKDMVKDNILWESTP